MIRLSFVSALFLAATGLPATSPEPLVIRSTTVVDVVRGTTRSGVTVIVRGDRIASVVNDAEAQVPAGANVVDGTGTWLTPGFIETHTHTTDGAALRRALALGITTALVIYTGQESPPEIEDWSALAESPSPRVQLVAGRFSGEFPGRFVPTAPKFSAPASREESEAMLDQLAKSGVKRIKIWQDDGTIWAGPNGRMATLKPEVVAALIRGAKRRAMQVYVHAWQLQPHRMVARLGPDALVHPVMDAELSRSDIRTLKNKHLGWMTTFGVLFYYGDRQGYAKRILRDERLANALSEPTRESFEKDAATPDFPSFAERFPALFSNFHKYLQTVRTNTNRVLDAGVVLSVGSDTTVGYGTHLEMEFLREAAVPDAVILKAATAGGATVLGRSGEIGTIEPGKLADLVILRSNPLIDIRNARDVAFVVKAGRLWSSQELLKNR